MIKVFLNRFVAGFMILLTLASCTPAGPGAPSNDALLSTSARAIDENLELVREYLSEDLPNLESLGTLTGEEVARRTLAESNGKRYLEFCYDTYLDNFDTTEDVIASVKGLVSDEDIELIRKESGEIERRLMKEFDPIYRKLSSEQQEAFNKDLRKLVVKAVVLFAASLVYSYIPSTVFWGKISAAIALAIAAGVLATTLMAIIEYYKAEKKGNSSLTLTEWLNEITTVPATSAALATGIISTGSAMQRSTFATSVILAAFGIFGIVDDVKEILTKYNFKV